MKSIKNRKNDIKKALESAGVYSTALDIQIKSLATALFTLDLANKEMASLESTTIYEVSKYGKKLIPHPVFRVAKEAQELITRQMKALGLTSSALTDTLGDTDPLVELTEKLINIDDTPTILKPDENETTE